MSLKEEVQDQSQARKGEEEVVNWPGGEVRREGTRDRGLLGTCKIGQVGREGGGLGQATGVVLAVNI